MSETSSFFVIGALLGLLQLLALYWIGRVDGKMDKVFTKIGRHEVKLANHNARIRNTENMCGLEHNEVEA